MGGGDLNSKKSWHPNTMKNQERVWKAEQVAAEEQKRILELQRERVEEKEQAEYNKMAKQISGTSVDDDRLHWMYDKPDRKAKEEDYLLGKAIDSNFDKIKKSDSDIPAVARRVVGSSMLTTAGDIQVDLARKMREDPLLLVKERERAARAALLNNPIHRRRIAELLRKEQELKEKKIKKKSKRKETKKEKEKDLDKILASKLSALGSEKVDLSSLLASDDSSSDDHISSDDSIQIKLKKKMKKQKKHKKLKTSDKCKKSRNIDAQSSDDDNMNRHKHGESSRKHGISSHKQEKVLNKKHKSSTDVSDNEFKAKKRRSENTVEDKRTDIRNQYESVNKKHKNEKECQNSKSEVHKKHKRTSEDRRLSKPSFEDQDRRERSSTAAHYIPDKKSKSLSKEEKEARLKAMVEAGAEREKERGRRVAEQRHADAVAEKISRTPRVGRSEAHSLPESLESRIHSNRHYIQRDKRHMDEHFARR